MRTAFIRTLVELAESDDRLWLVCGDLGYSVLEPFRERFPSRFLNAGVAEQNMTGVAAGLALAGKVPFTYSIANFPVMRCLEQVRNDVCYHGLNVKIVAVGAGLAYGSAGYSHHAVEDIAIMRALPNMLVLSPADPVEAALVTRMAAAHEGPCYLRLGKAGEALLHQSAPRLVPGRGILVRDGNATGGLLLATGSITTVAMAAAALLSEAGQEWAVMSMPVLHPLDQRALLERMAQAPAVLTLEEHGVGGLGSIVSELLAATEVRPRFQSLRLDNVHVWGGDQDALRARSGLTAGALCAVAKGLMTRP